MKKLRIIGGISWVSTAEYYRLINEGVNERLGGLNFAQCLIHSFNYADIKKNNDANDWDATFAMTYEASLNLKNGGAEAIVLCANTMHLIADRLEEKLKLPLIHIARATATDIKKKHIRKVGLLGTKFTMELGFFTSELNEQHIESVIPEAAAREFIQHTIYHELGKAIIREETKQRYIAIIRGLVERGAEGIILGCTEIPLLIKPEDVSVHIFDTARIHCAAAIDFSLS